MLAEGCGVFIRRVARSECALNPGVRAGVEADEEVEVTNEFGGVRAGMTSGSGFSLGTFLSLPKIPAGTSGPRLTN